jgi:hypothetical protein
VMRQDVSVFGMKKISSMPSVPARHLFEARREHPAASEVEAEDVEKLFLTVSGSALDPSKVVGWAYSAL